MKTIGIIGGMSYHSSLYYYKLINDLVNKELGGLNSANIIVYNVNFQQIKNLMNNNKWDKIGIILSDAAKWLENAGADIIAIASCTMHKVYDEINLSVHIPVLHVADAIAYRCNERNVKRVGLIGTKTTMTDTFLSDELKKHDLEVYVLNNNDDILAINGIITHELYKGQTVPMSKKKILSIVNKGIKETGIDGIILGSTSLVMLLSPKDFFVPTFDATASHISMIAECSLRG